MERAGRGEGIDAKICRLVAEVHLVWGSGHDSGGGASRAHDLPNKGLVKRLPSVHSKGETLFPDEQHQGNDIVAHVNGGLGGLSTLQPHSLRVLGATTL